MVRRGLAALSLALGIVILAAPVAGKDDAIGRIELTGVIDQVNANYIEEALRTAADNGNAAALIVIDSPGGELTSMASRPDGPLGQSVSKFAREMDTIFAEEAVPARA